VDLCAASGAARSCRRHRPWGAGGDTAPQACRQRAYENRNALERGAIPADAVVLTQQERDDLADRLYQMRCAAEDVATALAEAAGPGELSVLVNDMLAAARSAERIR